VDFYPKEAEMKYCGIDLHWNNRVVLVSDEEDRIVLQNRLPNDLGQIEAALQPHRDELAGVVIESTFNWYWLVDGLMDAGYQVHLAHPSAIKKYEGLKYSGDFADAGYLAQLLRLGLLAEGYIYPRQVMNCPSCGLPLLYPAATGCPRCRYDLGESGPINLPRDAEQSLSSVRQPDNRRADRVVSTVGIPLPHSMARLH
jgi:hypothetical protein